MSDPSGPSADAKAAGAQLPAAPATAAADPGTRDRYTALVAALLEACKFCDAPENRNEIVALLARREYVGTPAATLRPAFDGKLDFAHGQNRSVTDFTVFHRDHANELGAQS